MKLKEKDKLALFALIGVLAIAAGAYVLLFSEEPDNPSDIDGFVSSVMRSSSVSLFFDVRGADADSSRLIYQCGVDLVGGKLLGAKTINTYACDDKGCLSASSAANGSNSLTYEQVKNNLKKEPYVLIAKGTPETKFFERHMEIYIDQSFISTCKLG